MELFFIIVIALAILFLAVIFQDRREEKLLCLNCGHMDMLQKTPPGGCLIELVLWMFFIIPGLVYSIWRLTNKVYICPKCKSRNLIPQNSPMAKKFMDEDD